MEQILDIYQTTFDEVIVADSYYREVLRDIRAVYHGILQGLAHTLPGVKVSLNPTHGHKLSFDFSGLEAQAASTQHVPVPPSRKDNRGKAGDHGEENTEAQLQVQFEYKKKQEQKQEREQEQEQDQEQKQKQSQKHKHKHKHKQDAREKEKEKKLERRPSKGGVMEHANRRLSLPKEGTKMSPRTHSGTSKGRKKELFIPRLDLSKVVHGDNDNDDDSFLGVEEGTAQSNVAKQLLCDTSPASSVNFSVPQQPHTKPLPAGKCQIDVGLLLRAPKDWRTKYPEVAKNANEISVHQMVEGLN